MERSNWSAMLQVQHDRCTIENRHTYMCMHVVQVDSKNLDGEPMPHEKYGLLGQAESTEDFMKSQVATQAGSEGRSGAGSSNNYRCES